LLLLWVLLLFVVGGGGGKKAGGRGRNYLRAIRNNFFYRAKFSIIAHFHRALEAGTTSRARHRARHWDQ
jgi:hypothetical protein